MRSSSCTDSSLPGDSPRRRHFLSPSAGCPCEEDDRSGCTGGALIRVSGVVSAQLSLKRHLEHLIVEHAPDRAVEGPASVWSQYL